MAGNSGAGNPQGIKLQVPLLGKQSDVRHYLLALQGTNKIEITDVMVSGYGINEGMLMLVVNNSLVASYAPGTWLWIRQKDLTVAE